MGPTSLLTFMRENEMDAPRDANTLGSNLWSAWKAGRIVRSANGVYRPRVETSRQRLKARSPTTTSQGNRANCSDHRSTEARQKTRYEQQSR